MKSDIRTFVHSAVAAASKDPAAKKPRNPEKKKKEKIVPTTIKRLTELGQMVTGTCKLCSKQFQMPTGPHALAHHSGNYLFLASEETEVPIGVRIKNKSKKDEVPLYCGFMCMLISMKITDGMAGLLAIAKKHKQLGVAQAYRQSTPDLFKALKAREVIVSVRDLNFPTADGVTYMLKDTVSELDWATAVSKCVDECEEFDKRAYQFVLTELARPVVLANAQQQRAVRTIGQEVALLEGATSLDADMRQLLIKLSERMRALGTVMPVVAAPAAAPAAKEPPVDTNDAKEPPVDTKEEEITDEPVVETELSAAEKKKAAAAAKKAAKKAAAEEREACDNGEVTRMDFASNPEPKPSPVKGGRTPRARS